MLGDQVVQYNVAETGPLRVKACEACRHIRFGSTAVNCCDAVRVYGCMHLLPHTSPHLLASSHIFLARQSEIIIRRSGSGILDPRGSSLRTLRWWPFSASVAAMRHLCRHSYTAIHSHAQAPLFGSFCQGSVRPDSGLQTLPQSKHRQRSASEHLGSLCRRQPLRAPTSPSQALTGLVDKS
ncbi:hypothetical protein IE81DRAFT_190179 [Ceraceosorus guamensis]|uniref:Uncharacterized protein n=1 Tax=Ceraceosorus guamensis TaxID=1522189 RepID=A0A316WCZ3_9BASI|nr:hypothetical protein IE81DRAFT_190179 [Ceraceosorus guamensis]PWN45405.1 hypothetical protein IE81DRAFT_190179 [Ceraceosorus guamensis]